MELFEAVAPSYEQLRPMKPMRTGTFPVYLDLPGALLAAAVHPDPTVAHVLATCAGYSYSDAKTVAMMMARLGLEDNRCLTVSESVDAMFICSTAFLVQSACGRVVILSYRGTEPANFINWLTDADVNPEKVAFTFDAKAKPFDVHGGFYRNVRATRYQVIGALQKALAGESIVARASPPPHRLEALYVTGHSLGAAMAAMMGLMLTVEGAYRPILEKLRGVYTYGQPMIGSPALAEPCNGVRFLREDVIRHIYRTDVVAALPPTASGDFGHFGKERQFVEQHGAGTWVDNVAPMKQISHLAELLMATLAFPARQLRWSRNLPWQHSLDDHGPQHYIAALTPPHVRSEFGD
jgi:Lipase (class 3)